jgi:hypothetical protein
MELPIIVETYRAALPEEKKPEAALLVAAAIDRARKKHADWERFLPGIDFLSHHIFVNHRDIPLDDFLECLYCCVKHGDFTKSWRMQLKKPAAKAE